MSNDSQGRRVHRFEFIVLANESLGRLHKKYPEATGQGLYDLWRASPSRFATPASDLSPIWFFLSDARDSGAAVDEVRLHVLADASDAKFAAYCADIAEMLALHLKCEWGADVPVKGLRYDVGIPLSEESDPVTLRTGVLDAIGQIADRLAADVEGDAEVVAMANLVAGVSAGKAAMSQACQMLGIPELFDRSGGAPRRPRFGVEPSHSWLVHGYGRAVSLLSSSLPPEALRLAIEQEQLEPFVVLTGEPRLSRCGLLLLADNTSFGPQLFSACAALLAGRQDEESARWAGRLGDLLKTWRSGQLFATNLVPEMALHSESHAAAVDRNVAAVCAPLLEAGILNPHQVYLLALAAWLHDWGHASARTGADGLRRPLDSMAVRQFHGLLTAVRLQDDRLRSLHGLSGAEGEIIGVLAGHHQGWTSFDEFRAPHRDLPKFGLGVPAAVSPDGEAESLTGDYNMLVDAGALDGTGVESLEQLKLLVAILRICDASDVGVHRVPHARDGLYWVRLTDAVELEAARCRELLLAMGASCAFEDVLRELTTAVPAARREYRESGSDAIERLCRRGGSIDAMFADRVKSLSPTTDALAALERLRDYVKHCVRQADYMEHHSGVLHVSLAASASASASAGAGGGRVSITPLVTPAPDTPQSQALAAVDRDVNAELQRPKRNDIGTKGVGTLLRGFGISVEPARLV